MYRGSGHPTACTCVDCESERFERFNQSLPQPIGKDDIEFRKHMARQYLDKIKFSASRKNATVRTSDYKLKEFSPSSSIKEVTPSPIYKEDHCENKSSSFLKDYRLSGLLILIFLSIVVGLITLRHFGII